MKLTVEIPDELFREAEAKAARNGSKLKDLVADGLRLVLVKGSSAPRQVRFPLFPARHGSARLTLNCVNEVVAAEGQT